MSADSTENLQLELDGGGERSGEGFEDEKAVAGAEERFAGSVRVGHHARTLRPSLRTPAMLSREPLGLLCGVRVPKGSV